MDVRAQRLAAMQEHVRRLFEYVNLRQPRRADREKAELSVGYLQRYIDDMRLDDGTDVRTLL